MSPGKKTRAELPYRPGYGVLRKPVTLYANYFELLPPANMVLFSYKTDIRPVAGTSDNAKIQLMQLSQLVPRNNLPQ